jgi:hypothetical protein
MIMMQRFRILPILVLLVGWLSSGATRAEVSSSRGPGDRARTLIVGSISNITDGADPVLDVPWDRVRPAPGVKLLNANGPVRPDGRPDVAFSPSRFWPFVVWAFNNQSDHDIAYAEWTGDGWGVTGYLTAGAENELDPRTFISGEGRIYVVWWVDAAQPYVMLTSRRLVSPDWEPPQRVSATGEIARRPTVVAVGDVLRVAYERSSNLDVSAPRELIIRRRNGNGPFEIEQVITSGATPELDPILHVLPGKLWLDWKHSDTEFGYATFGDSWGPAVIRPWNDPSWVGVEDVRRAIRFAVATSADVSSLPGSESEIPTGP